jgi:hypothetical protein
MIVEEKTSGAWNPVVLIVTIESEAELRALWARLNLAWAKVRSGMQAPSVKPDKHEPHTGLFKVLDDIADRLGLKENRR